jgi:hypothetical protein
MLASGTVNVTTMARCCTVAPNTPEPGIVVVAINPDGSLAGTATTGADGKASLTVSEGASVTAIYPEDDDHQNDIRTYVGVKPDDNLTFGDAYYDVQQTGLGLDGQMTVNWTAVTGAERYRVHTACDSSGYTTVLTTSMPLYMSCQRPTSPLLVLAVDVNYQTIASAYIPAAASTVGATVNIGAGQWVTQAVENVAISVSGVDPVVQYASLRGIARYPQYGFEDSDNPTLEAGAGSAMVSIPATAPVKYARVALNRNGNFGEQNFYKGGEPPYVLAATSLPWLEGDALFSAAQRRLFWFETSGTYDAAVLYAEWSRSENKTTQYYNWTIILPPNVAEFRFPTPPAELEAFLPTAKDYIDHELSLVDLSSAADYDAARALPEWRLSNAEGAVANGDEPTAGITSDGEGFSFSD